MNLEPNTAALPSRRTIPATVLEFSELRLSTPIPGKPIVLFEYEDSHGTRSIHQVSLTCSGEGPGGLIYFGGYEKGAFRIFRADCIHRVVTL